MRISAQGLGLVLGLLLAATAFGQEVVSLPHVGGAKTARVLLPGVQSEAKTWAEDARLIAIESSRIDTAGLAPEWHFLFYSDTFLQFKAFRAAHGRVVTVALDDRELPDAVSLPAIWLNSDSAAVIAEAKGGRRFRSEYPQAQLFAFLHSINLFAGSHPGLPFSYPHLNALFRNAPLRQASVGALHAGESVAIWFFFYYSIADMAFFDVAVDAGTGVFLFDSDGISARAGLTKAKEVALDWAPDVHVLQVETPSVSPKGLANEWIFTFISATRDSVLEVRAIKNLLFRSRMFAGPAYSSTLPLPEAWLGSVGAMASATAVGRQFLSIHQDTRIDAVLANGLLPDQAALWRFRYFSPASGEILEVLVDARGGGLVTGTPKQSNSPAPVHFSLKQNYPNPFNPTTVIEYELPKIGQVTLTVLNLLGQKVRRFVRQEQQAGLYRIVWDGRDHSGNRVAPGIYIYRLQTASLTVTRRMVLLP